MSQSLLVVTNPFTIISDQQEKHPFTFQNFFVPRKRKGQIVEVPLLIDVEVRHLKTGDYAIDGWEDRVTVERKSLEDLYQTLSWGRERFHREMQRMRAMDIAWVVVETDWQYILNPPKKMTGEAQGMDPSAVYHTILSWQSRYPNVHWVLCTHRRFAEQTTFHLLNHYWRLHRPGGKLEKEASAKG